MQHQLLRLLRPLWVRHSGFWILSVGILTAGFAFSWPPTLADVIYTLLFHISLLVAVYAHLEVLIPLLLQRKRYVQYVLALIVLLIATVLLNEFTYRNLSDWIFPGYYFISYYSYWQIALFIAVYLLVTTLLRFSQSWAELQRTKLALEESRRLNTETELRALREQVSPHFLFNSLHSIYALSLDGNPRTADLLLKLGDILRFHLYENQKERIPLSKEIECIEAYVALQRERLSGQGQIVVLKEIKGTEPLVAPLLLMPLVENAFKHGSGGRDTRVEMTLSYASGKLGFEIRNRTSLSKQTDATGGLGLSNLRRRLELQYPGRHALRISAPDDMYLVQLSINV
jgi:sensor histidine kinase YesM